MLAYKLAILPSGYARLLFHQLALAFLRHRFINFSVKLVGSRVLFIRIREHADAIKLRLAHAVSQLIEIFFALAGKSDNEGCADGNIRHALAYALDQSLI